MAELCARFPVDAHLVTEVVLVHVGGRRDPGQSAPGRPADGLVGVRGHPDRGVRPLDRAQRDRDVVELYVVLGVAHPVLGPQSPDQVEVVQVPAQPTGLAHPEGREFHVPVAQADPEGEPAVAQDVQGGHLLGEVHRAGEREQADCRAETHLAQLRNNPRQHGQWVQVLERVGKVMLGGEDGREPRVPDEPNLVELLLEALGSVVTHRVLAAQKQSDPEGRRVLGHQNDLGIFRTCWPT